ncbi:MAG: PEP/pyruvate-binding domain-containing protein [Saccharofermentanales bacterium]
MERYKNVDKDILVERAKELECLYLIDEALASTPFPAVMQEVANLIPVGFKNMDSCLVTIGFDGEIYRSKPMAEVSDEIETPIILNRCARGYIKVGYPPNTFPPGEEAFLPEEKRLLNIIAGRIAEFQQHRIGEESEDYKNKWKTILDLLQKTDNKMLLYVCSRMITLLSSMRPDLLHGIYNKMGWQEHTHKGEVNAPLKMLPDIDVLQLSETLFAAASTCIDDQKIFEDINLWIYQRKTYDLARIVSKKHTDARSIIDALRKYIENAKTIEGFNAATNRWLKVELIRRFLTENHNLITTTQDHIRIESFCDLLESFIGSSSEIGKIGGKGAGIFIAREIIEANKDREPLLEGIKTPRTWYISAEELANLLSENELDELNEHKYKDIVEIRSTYPRIIQLFKNLRFPAHINHALSEVLDLCTDNPLIVRSSSLLEDQLDASFSGKYKSLFIPNAGTKSERKKQLIEGILEVYASMYNPDSIQYRKKRNLLDFSEQMGILIQEVVGRKVGPYYFPLYAGMAFSCNELRWSPRIRREDGLLRLVMGLGTRAVDRVGDDFPTLISPGQPGLRVNQTPDEIKKYSPQMIDLIDLEKRQFSSMPIRQLIKEQGNSITKINQVASTFKDELIKDTNIYTANFAKDEFVVTFEGLFRNTQFLAKIKAVLDVLRENLGYPVDIEFASDGESLYLLQCRPQSRNLDNAPVALPADIPHSDTIFTARKYVSNGKVTGIKTVVYVDPEEYISLSKHEDYLRVSYAVSELNRTLPRRSFILLGPGRWGSRGDIKLGVPVTYSDINNTAMLIEVASKESRHQPELSFGTHFFQDLVEENIKYLPLYPDDSNVVFKRSFFNNSKNSLSNILPDYADLAHVIKVIQVEEEFNGKNLFVLMNADLENAMAFLDKPTDEAAGAETAASFAMEPETSADGWQWRFYMAEKIAQKLDMDAYNVKGVYLIGSTCTGTAKLCSDIDLLIHLDASVEQQEELDAWLRGWSLALSEMNYLKTGYETNGLLDVHYITDQDIKDKSSFAIKINSPYDPAYRLRVK